MAGRSDEEPVPKRRRFATYGYEYADTHEPRRQGWFVDKTKFIEVMHGFNDIAVIRPSCFGKSTMASMVDDYFNMEVDGEFTPIKGHNTRSYLFDNTHIAVDKTTWEAQGCHPVIRLNFNTVRNNVLEETDKIIRSFLRTRFPFLHIDYDCVAFAFDVIIETVYAYFNQKVIVIIDAFDTPLNFLLKSHQGATKDVAEPLCAAAKEYYEFLCGILRQREYMHFTLLLGSILPEYSRLFKDNRNLFQLVSSLTIPGRFSDFFCYTDSEVERLLPSTLTPEHKKRIQSWYQLIIPNNSSIQKIYCPHSINQCIANDYTCDLYREATGASSFLPSFLEIDVILDEVYRITKYGCIKSGVSRRPNVRGRYTVHALPDTVGILLQNGVVVTQNPIESWSDTHTLRIGNTECVEILKRMVRESKTFQTFIKYEYFERLRDNLLSYDWIALQTTLRDYFAAVTNPLKCWEIFYQAVMGTILEYTCRTTTPTNYIYDMESTSGHGRSDIVFFSLDKDKKDGIIFEYAIAYNKADLTRMREVKRRQVLDKDYEEYFRRYKHITSIRIVAITFLRCGPDITVTACACESRAPTEPPST